MKSEVGLEKVAARVLRDDAEHPAEQPPEQKASTESRAATIAAMARVIRQRKQKKRLRWGLVAMSGIAVAASLALVLGGRAASKDPAVAASFVKGTPMVVRGAEHITLTDGVALKAGDHLIVREGTASRMTIGFAQGTHVAIDDHADLEMTSAGPSTTSFHLAAGSVRADVAKLLPGESFVIRTADAEVEVHGTSFEVTHVAETGSNCAKSTRVRVREGVVAVRSEGKETLVRANEVWPSCEQHVTAPPTASASASASAPNPNPTPTPTDSTAAAPPPFGPSHSSAKPSSDLAAQNDLFEAAISKKRVGDTRGAITTFEDLLARYPQSHLAQSARAERMKLLRSVDRTQARTAATDYLKRYPTGFARHDAEVILSD